MVRGLIASISTSMPRYRNLALVCALHLARSVSSNSAFVVPTLYSDHPRWQIEVLKRYMAIVLPSLATFEGGEGFPCLGNRYIANCRLVWAICRDSIEDAEWRSRRKEIEKQALEARILKKRKRAEVELKTRAEVCSSADDRKCKRLIHPMHGANPWSPL